MASSSSKAKKGSEMLVKGTEWKAPSFKIVPAIAESLDPNGAQSQIPPKVLLINDIRTHFRCTIQEIGTLDMDNALAQLCVDGALKPEFNHLEVKGLTHIPHMPRNFQVKWMRYILSRVHNGQLWLDQPILITKKMIHRITGLPMLNKAKTTKTLGREELQKLTLAVWDGRGLKLNNVSDIELKFGICVIAYRLYSSSRLNSVPCEAVDLAYKVVKKNMDFDLADMLLKQLNKNMESIRTSKTNPCKFGSLLICIFFYVQKFFPSKGTVVWRTDTPVLYQINEFIAEMGENCDSILDNYFEDFKEKMNNRFRIPPKLVEDYKDDVCFMVDCDRVYIQAVRPRVAWVKPLPYEVNIDETRDIIEALVNEPVDPKLPAFGTYDEAKVRIEIGIKLPQAISKGKRTIERIKAITEDKSEDTDDDESEEEKEPEKEEVPPKKKGKVTITKPQQPTAVFSRRTRAGKKEVVFRKPPPTFEERIKDLDSGSGMSTFKSLKYETRTDAEKMQIEELVLSKMGKWKYTPENISSQIPNELLQRIQPRWSSAVKTVKDIYEQSLKQLIPTLSYKEVKEAQKVNEHLMTLRFHTFLVLTKQIEQIVKDSTEVWRRVYNMPMPSDDPAKEAKEGDDTVIIEDDVEEEEDDEIEMVEKEVEEEDETVMIAAEAIASLPHSPPKPVKSTMEIGSPSMTISITDTSFTPVISQLEAPTVEVSITSSTEQQGTSSSTEPPSTSSATELPSISTVTDSTAAVTLPSVSLPPAVCIVSVPALSTILSSSATLAPLFTPVSTSSVNIPACTSFLGGISSFATVSTSLSLPLVGQIPVITASPTTSTIVSYSKGKGVVLADKPKQLLLTGKEIDEDIDLDEEIVLPKIDLDNATVEELRLLSQKLEQKARQKQLRNERDREFNIIESAKNIITEAIGVEVDTSQHILLQLEEAVTKFNEETSGQEKLLDKAERKFENKVIEHIAQHIAIKQVELSSILSDIENSLNNATSLFEKLCNVTEYTKEIREKLDKVDEDLKISAQSLKSDPSSSSSHHLRIRFLSEKQAELLREGGRIRTTLLDIQNMILPIMDTMQKHIAHSKTLIHDNNFSIADHVIELSAEVQVALSTCKILQANWDNTLQLILKVHSEFITHFGVPM